MDASGTSLDLLAHFDWPDADEVSRPQLRPPVGVICVVKWAAAAGVLFFAACVLLQLTYCIAAEQKLSHAARAGVLEATLPRATHESVVETIKRRMVGHSISISALQITIQQNDAPVQRDFRLAGDDRVSVALSAPVDAALPAWLCAVTLWNGGARIEARAERHVPSRQLRMAGHR